MTREELKAILDLVVSKRSDRLADRPERIEAILDVVIDGASMYSAEDRHQLKRNSLRKTYKAVEDFIALGEGLKSRNVKKLREGMVDEGFCDEETADEFLRRMFEIPPHIK